MWGRSVDGNSTSEGVEDLVSFGSSPFHEGHGSPLLRKHSHPCSRQATYLRKACPKKKEEERPLPLCICAPHKDWTLLLCNFHVLDVETLFLLQYLFSPKFQHREQCGSLIAPIQRDFIWLHTLPVPWEDQEPWEIGPWSQHSHTLVEGSRRSLRVSGLWVSHLHCHHIPQGPRPPYTSPFLSLSIWGAIWGDDQLTISKVRVNIELLIVVTSRVLDNLNKKDSTK